MLSCTYLQQRLNGTKLFPVGHFFKRFSKSGWRCPFQNSNFEMDIFTSPTNVLLVDTFWIKTPTNILKFIYLFKNSFSNTSKKLQSTMKKSQFTMHWNKNLWAATPCKVNPGNFNFLKKLKLPGFTLHGIITFKFAIC